MKALRDDEQSSTGESKYDNIPTLVGEVLDAQNEDGSAKSQAELDELEQTLRSKIFLADKTASMFGDSSLGGAVNEIKGATIDWIERIRDFLTGSMKTLSSWNRLNKRHAWRGINLPSQIGVNSGGEIAIAIDTSGSVSQPELDYIAQVVQLICEELGIEKVRVCYCDTRVHKNSDGEWWDKFDLSQNEDLSSKLEVVGVLTSTLLSTCSTNILMMSMMSVLSFTSLMGGVRLVLMSNLMYLSFGVLLTRGIIMNLVGLIYLLVRYILLIFLSSTLRCDLRGVFSGVLDP